MGDDLYLPFDSPDRQWVLDRFGSRDFTDRAAYLRGLRDKLAANVPALQANFAVYLDAPERMLVYVKEPCYPADTAARFFLHIYPVDPADLPKGRRPYSFDNRDFSFDLQGILSEKVCIGLQSLPDYPIAAVRTGQFAGAAQLWAGEIQLNPE